jgi:nitroreductase
VSIVPEIENRRSHRSYADKPVDQPALTSILEAGRHAPSAKNRQAWRFIAVTNPDTRKRIESACYGQEYVGQAPVHIALCTTNIDYRMPNGQLSYPIDMGIAAGFMMLQAEAEGLGTCPITTFDQQELKEILTVPYSMTVVLLLLVGHPTDTNLQTPRKPLDLLVSYDHW